MNEYAGMTSESREGWSSGGSLMTRAEQVRVGSPLARQFDEIRKASEVYGALLAELTERLEPALSPAQTIGVSPEDGDRAMESPRVAQARDCAHTLYVQNERLRLLIDRIEV